MGKILFLMVLFLCFTGRSNAATYEVTVQDEDVPLLNAFLLGTANTDQVGTSTIVGLDGEIIPPVPSIPLTPKQYLDSLVETFIGGLREQAKEKEAGVILERAKNITPQEKAFIGFYEKMTPEQKKALLGQFLPKR